FDTNNLLDNFDSIQVLNETNQSETSSQLETNKLFDNFNIDNNFSNEELESTEPSTKLLVGQSFETWDDTENFLKRYGLQKGFDPQQQRNHLAKAS
ncbi:3236_t:CDS:2, partial [Racocetra fulgida]